MPAGGGPLRVALERSPDTQEYRLALAEALLRLGQAHQASAEFSRATADWRRAAALVEAVFRPDRRSSLFIDAGVPRLDLAPSPDSEARVYRRTSELWRPNGRWPCCGKR